MLIVYLWQLRALCDWSMKLNVAKCIKAQPAKAERCIEENVTLKEKLDEAKALRSNRLRSS
jgi:hypothetical protein